MPFQQKKGALCLDLQKGMGTAYEGHVWVSVNILDLDKLVRSLFITSHSVSTMFVKNVYNILVYYTI